MMKSSAASCSTLPTAAHWWMWHPDNLIWFTLDSRAFHPLHLTHSLSTAGVHLCLCVCGSVSLFSMCVHTRHSENRLSGIWFLSLKGLYRVGQVVAPFQGTLWNNDLSGLTWARRWLTFPNKLCNCLRQRALGCNMSLTKVTMSFVWLCVHQRPDEEVVVDQGGTSSVMNIHYEKEELEGG